MQHYGFQSMNGDPRVLALIWHLLILWEERDLGSCLDILAILRNPLVGGVEDHGRIIAKVFVVEIAIIHARADHSTDRRIILLNQ